MENFKISEFYETMYVDAASYDNIRKISSYIDGLKNSSRKVIYTVLDKGIKNETKVSRLKSTVSEHTEYLHGEDNISGVIVTLAKNYVGSNNLPLLRAEGSFGTRFVNEASADRYIFTGAAKYLDKIFKWEDFPVLKHQMFEGNKIEPRFFVPIIPLALLNGSKGVSSGYAQIVLPRPIKGLIKSIEKYLKTGKIEIPKPGWEGFKGRVENAGGHKWVTYGVFERKGKTLIEISEIPIGYELKKYIEVLDDLEEKGIITSYEDLSEDDNFHFRVRVNRKLAEADDETIYEILKLKDSGNYLVENLTFIDENNKIVVFDSVEQLFENYANIRLDYYQKRKDYLISKIVSEMKKLASIYVFINAVNSGKIDMKRKKSEIEKDLSSIEKIIKIDGSFDYLLRIPIGSLTKEKMEELVSKIKENRNKLETLKEKSPKDIWFEDLSDLKKAF